MHLFVVGAGPVGLTTAAGFARLGRTVTVHDIDAARRDTLRAGRAPFFEPGLDEAVADGIASGRLRVSDSPTPPADAAVSIVCVPTPSAPDGRLSMAIVAEVVERLLDATGPTHTIVVRSTLPLDGPDRLLELAAARETRAAIVTNPEFMREGNAVVDFERPNRVVVGWLTEADRPAAEAVASLYASLDAPTLVADARSAALMKLATNVFLAVKIGFANELARLADAMGADVETVTRGLGLDPRIGPAFLRPGPGYGGSCLPEQAVAIGRELEAREVPGELLRAVGRVNATHQKALVARLAALLGGLSGRRVALLGLAFKSGTDDVRESPALVLARELRAAGATVVGHDPKAARTAAAADPELEVARSVEEALTGADVAVVTTEWPQYTGIDWAVVAPAMAGELVFDTRGIVDGRAVAAAGLRFVALGRPEKAAPVRA